MRTPLGAVVLAISLGAFAGERHYRLEAVDLRQPILWGATCELPDGSGLAFGGHEQAADDGAAHTRIREGGAWKPIRGELEAANPLQTFRDRLWAIRTEQKNLFSRARRLYFEAEPDTGLWDDQVKIQKELAAVVAELRKLDGLGAYEAGQVEFALSLLRSVKVKEAQVPLEKAAEALGAEPPPRAYSPIAYDEKTKLFVLFGGDHLDYLTSDTWVLDPAKRKWMQRHPPTAPPPRARHQLKAAGAKVTLSGGYTYSSSTDYCGGQYKDVADGEWTYDIAANTWTGGDGVPPMTRVYRTGPYHPDFFLDGPKPDPAEVDAKLKGLPPNAWVPMRPPRIPRLDRCWGTAVLDPDHDLVLVWSGGHSSHCGSDVLHYHLSTNRWELPFPVEFPLGQTYSNTSYPGGFNFNLRPWVTGHTYQSYGYDPLSKRMLFTGHTRHQYVYDPEVADWVGRAEKPKGMVHNDCFYTLTLVPTPGAMLCWTQSDKVFRLEPQSLTWSELEVSGKLPGSAVDYSTAVYDSKRDRLLVFRTGYGQKYDGQVHALDLKTLAASALSPPNAAAASSGFAIDRAVYEPECDLVLFAALIPGGEPESQRTPAYDCAGNRWVSLKIGYEVEKRDRKVIPLTPRGPGHSCGVVFDARRKLIWGVDTYHLQPYALRLDAKTTDLAELKP